MQCNRTLLLLLHISLPNAEIRVEMTQHLVNHLQVQGIYPVRLRLLNDGFELEANTEF